MTTDWNGALPVPVLVRRPSLPTRAERIARFEEQAENARQALAGCRAAYGPLVVQGFAGTWEARWADDGDAVAGARHMNDLEQSLRGAEEMLALYRAIGRGGR